MPIIIGSLYVSSYTLLWHHRSSANTNHQFLASHGQIRSYKPEQQWATKAKISRACLSTHYRKLNPPILEPACFDPESCQHATSISQEWKTECCRAAIFQKAGFRKPGSQPRKPAAQLIQPKSRYDSKMIPSLVVEAKKRQAMSGFQVSSTIHRGLAYPGPPLFSRQRDPIPPRNLILHPPVYHELEAHLASLVAIQ